MAKNQLIQLGSMKIDPVEYASQGNAILGIRDSGKTYTATFMAEQLFEAGIPFIVFDPIGVWRFLRVPARHQGGKGYPVVVAGGQEGDLPLTVAGAPEIVRAAMHNGVSLVIDLFDMKLSKADWRRIVMASVRVLLHENQKHGLRHVFLEEAAEFIPQKVLDGAVYAELEKLARMGGNSRLGYTLINQRSQEVSKAILELCENMFLHRQRGKNALDNLDKWLQIAGAEEQKAIIKSLPSLPQGECWAWLGGDKPTPPTLVKVPRKNSLHPDRRVMRGDTAVKPKNAVDVGQFVQGMRATLVTVEAEDKANNPVLLRQRIAELEAAAKKTPAPAVDQAAIAAAEQRGFERGYDRCAGVAVRSLTDFTTIKFTGDLMAGEGPKPDALSPPAVIAALRKQGEQASAGGGLILDKRKPAAPGGGGDGSLTSTMRETLQALAWWAAVGHRAPTKKQLAGMLGIVADGSTMRSRLAALTAPGLIEYPEPGRVSLTDAGTAAAPAPDRQAGLVETIRASLTATERETFDAIPADPAQSVSREDLGLLLGGIEPAGSTMRSRLANLSTREIIRYPGNGYVARQDWVIG